MRKLKVLSRANGRNDGYTRAELGAEIRRRAYELYEDRGRTDGHALEDWLQAEGETLRRGRPPVAAQES